jgi:hypothetical protein
MEGPAGNHIKNRHLFFVLGAGDDLAANLKKTAVRVAVRLNTSVEYLMNIPMDSLLELVDEIMEMDEERRNHGK